MKFQPGNQPLQCEIEDDQLVIRIGLDTLAFAAEHCEVFYDEDRHATTGPPYVKVEDKTELAKDIRAALLDENEVGTTELHRLFDAAFWTAYEDGSLGFADEEESEATR